MSLLRALGCIVFASMVFFGCRWHNLHPSANVSGDTLSDAPATLGETPFKCRATLRQVWFDGAKGQDFANSTKRQLDLVTPESTALLNAKQPFEAMASHFGNEKKENISDSPNLNNVKISASFAASPTIGCVDGMWELRFVSITTVASLPRNTTVSHAYCWDPRGSTVQVFQTLSFGPRRQDVGARIQQELDMSSGSADPEATAVEYSVICKRVR